MVLQLSGGVEALTASIPKEGELPLAVSLAKGAVHEIVVNRLRRLLAIMSSDAVLELGPTTGRLLATAADLKLRIEVFTKYPFSLCFLYRQWFPVKLLQSILEFLNEREEKLDVGVGLQLQGLGWAERCEMDAISWLASVPLQEFIEKVCSEALASSLEVERRMAQTKKWESSKATHAATASRNMICARFAKNREAKSLALATAMRRLERARHTTVGSLRWQERGSIRPEGVPWSSQWQPFQGALRPQVPFQPKAASWSHVRAQRSQAVSTAARETLQLKEKQAELIQSSQRDVDRLLRCSDTPITRPQWAAWLDDNIQEFSERMKTAPERRRAGSTCLRARQDLPQPAKRIQPEKQGKMAFKTGWAANLAGRTGWHGIQTTTEKIMFFLACHGGQTHYIDLAPIRLGDELAYAFTGEFDLVEQLQPLTLLDAAYVAPCASRLPATTPQAVS